MPTATSLFEGLSAPAWFRASIAQEVVDGRALGDELLALADDVARRDRWIASVHPVPADHVSASELEVVRAASAGLDDAGRAAAKAYARHGLVSSRLDPDSPWVQLLREIQADAGNIGHAGLAAAARAEHLLATGSDEVIDLVAAAKPLHPEIRPELLLDGAIDPATIPVVMRDSHPSGHGTIAGFAGEVLGLADPSRTAGMQSRIADAAWARVARTDHYPHDVLEGVRLGTAWARVVSGTRLVPGSA
jgi:hypothetical protein